MGGSKSQTVGYTYFKGLMAVIGNRIERLLDINPDKKGWILTPEQKQQLEAGRASVLIDQPNLFGGEKKEGGWVGAIDVYVGEDDQPQNTYLAKQINEDVSAYPNLSYLVFHAQNSLDKGFQLVSMSGMMKEFMLWVKRIHIKNDGSTQWYDPKAEIGFYRNSGNSEVNKVPVRVLITSHREFAVGGWKVNDFPSISDTIYSDYSSSYIAELYPYSGVTTRDQVSESDYCKLNATVDPINNGWCSASISIRITGQEDRYHNLSGSYVILSLETTEIIGDYGVPELIITYEVQFNTEIPFSVNSGAKNPYFVPNSIPSNWTIDTRIKIRLIKFLGGNYFVELDAPDINPIHKIREILTDYTAMGKPESKINDENFKFMADRIYDEGLGISWCIQQKSCKEALEELEYHIEGGVRINRQTGLYEVILFRDDLLNLDDALHFDESNIKSFQPDIINAEDQINAVNVSFYDRVNIKDSSFSLSDVGSFHTIDHENAEDLKFPYFMNRRNAEMVANWKLKQLSTMAWKGTFTTGKYEARRLNKYDVVLLSWKSKNIVNLPVRVMNINLGNGRDNTVTLDFVEVVPYSNISYSSINVDPNPNPILPPQSNSSIVFEMPYFEAVQRMGQTSVDTELANNPEIGYLMAAAIKPQNNSLSALLYTDGGTGIYTEFEEVGVVEYCAACYLDQNISHTDTSFAIKSVKDLSRVKLGTLVQVDEELLVYHNYDAETKILTVKRGALDTIPKPHLIDAVFYFWDDSSGLDSTSYVEGETLKAQVLTTTPSGIENLDPSNVQSLEIVGRANRPYPPANVKINGEYWLDEIENDLVLTWLDRNRVQQTGGEILGWFDSGVTLESGVSYQLVLIERDENDVVLRTQNLSLGSINAYTFATSSMDANTFSIEITLKSLRDGFDSYQSFNHVVERSLFFSAPYDLTVEFKND